VDKSQYDEYLHGDHWRHVRYLADLRAIKANGGNCERCHRNPIECHHHWTYRSLGREECSLADVLACCSGCHAFLHHRSDYDPAAPMPPDHEVTPDFQPEPDDHGEYGQGYMIDRWGIWEVRGEVPSCPLCSTCGWDAEMLTENDEPICRECLRQRHMPD
jgi:hypothetical protein